MIESMMYESPARPIYAVGDSKNTGLPMRPLQQVRSFGLWYICLSPCCKDNTKPVSHDNCMHA